MKVLTKEEIAILAPIMFAAGENAFSRGEKCSPSLDPSFRVAIDGLSIGGGSEPLAMSWMKGWNTAEYHRDYPTN